MKRSRKDSETIGTMQVRKEARLETDDLDTKASSSGKCGKELMQEARGCGQTERDTHRRQVEDGPRRTDEDRDMHQVTSRLAQALRKGKADREYEDPSTHKKVRIGSNEDDARMREQ